MSQSGGKTNNSTTESTCFYTLDKSNSQSVDQRD